MGIRIEDIDNIDISDITTGEKISPSYPGILLCEILEEFGLSQKDFAKIIQVSPMQISHVIHGSRRITAELALKLGKVFGQAPEFWLTLQSSYDLVKAEQSPGLELDKIKELSRGSFYQNGSLDRENDRFHLKSKWSSTKRTSIERSSSAHVYRGKKSHKTEHDEPHKN